MMHRFQRLLCAVVFVGLGAATTLPNSSALSEAIFHLKSAQQSLDVAESSSNSSSTTNFKRLKKELLKIQLKLQRDLETQAK